MTLPLPESYRKVCNKCGEPKPIGEFYKNSKTTDGHLGACKKCVNKASTARNQANPEKRRAYIAKYNKKNRDKVNAYSVEWKKKNPDKRAEIVRRYYLSEKGQESYLRTKENNRETVTKRSYERRRSDPVFKAKMNSRQLARYYMNAAKDIPRQCVECGTAKKMQVHHIDLNPLNNDLANLEWRCHDCHVAIHTRIRRETREAASLNQGKYLGD